MAQKTPSLWAVLLKSMAGMGHQSSRQSNVALLLLFLCIFQCVPAGRGHSCHSCADPFMWKKSCDNQVKKIVDFSGLCPRCESAVSCSHQIAEGLPPTGCIFAKGCPANASGEPSLLQCNGPSGPSCKCPDQPDGGAGAGVAGWLEDLVTVTAYPYVCNCTVETGFTTALDIRVNLTGWRALGLVLLRGLNNIRCVEFRLSPAAAGHSPARLQYDCPTFPPKDQGTRVQLQLCAGMQTVNYRLRLPFLNNISEPALASWEPLVLVHMHRWDRLVFSVQRAPPTLCVRRYSLQLVLCERADCQAHRPIVGTELQREEDCSKSGTDAGSFRVEYELPSVGGNISLLVVPEGGRPTLSAAIDYATPDTLYIVAVVILVTVLLLVVAVVVWIKYFRKLPKCLDVLVVYNRNTNLVRLLASGLEKYCLVKPKMDIVDIPRADAGMDPAEWLTTELKRCRHVLVLVFPDTTAPPIYPRLFSMALHHLKMDAGRKTRPPERRDYEFANHVPSVDELLENGGPRLSLGPPGRHAAAAADQDDDDIQWH
ncbi:uncharacterized protein LOC119094253 [Pollicipes pollicipes]|uniref:uncharacterized protein LOC119094253 n=1 Tax=Pollicipes pollicipes TaxID=41117 RepID=UPI0018853EBF|nr:uncharacterized protein LOC119094253 [Pollicipes pollicipes]